MPSFHPLKDIIDENIEISKSINEKRRELIKKIEEKFNGNLITYISNPLDPFSLIEPGDAELIMDLLGSIDTKDNLYLLINSAGGDLNTADKIIMLCREYCKNFYVISPLMAKSAATIIALGSDQILMGPSSELGPIDAQLVSFIPTGEKVVIPARSFVQAYNFLQDEIMKNGKPPQMIMPLIMRIDPIMLQNCKNQLEFGLKIAQKWLKTCMWKEDQNIAGEIARSLNEDFISHGAVINHKEAENIGLKIKYLTPDSEDWKLIWEYYIRSINQLNHAQQTKLFESREISLNRKVFLQLLPMGSIPPGAPGPPQPRGPPIPPHGVPPI